MSAHPLPGPKTLAERLDWLRGDAKRILAAPEQFRADEVQWAKDMLDSDRAADLPSCV
jgi:hypothetical protein